MKIKRICTLCLAALCLVYCLHISGAAAGPGGSCGSGVSWSLDTETGVLTVSGSGAMNDYEGNDVPWWNYRNGIRTVVVENSVTGIGKWAFYDCTALVDVQFGNGVESIGEMAFFDCIALTEIMLPASTVSIEDSAFSGACAISDVYYRGTEAQWGDMQIDGGNFSAAVIHYNTLAPGVSCTGGKTEVRFRLSAGNHPQKVLCGIYRDGRMLGAAPAQSGKNGVYTVTINCTLSSAADLEFRIFSCDAVYCPVGESVSLALDSLNGR